MVMVPGLGRLRRGPFNSNGGNDIEQQRAVPGSEGFHGESEMREAPRPRSGSRGGLFPLGRPTFSTILHPRQSSSPTDPISERPAQGEQRETRDGQVENEGDIESPKTPRFTLGLPVLPSTRLHLPHLTRTWTNGSNGPASRPGTARPGTSRDAEPQQSRFLFSFSRSTPTNLPEPPAAAQPLPLVNQAQVRSHQTIERVGPANEPVTQMAGNGGNSRDRNSASSLARRRGQNGRDGMRRQERPRKFLFCFPWIRSRRVRSQILRCFVSGMFLTLLLSIYLALSITNNISNSEFSVLLILIILFTTIFFCHGLIRLCMLVVRPRPDDDRRSNLPQMMGPGGYAVPRQPIRVVLAQDEEAAGIESEAAKTKPPAYGLWRESVRVDPNRLFWQRNENAPAESSSRPSESRSSPRPPSYASDDGVTYVVEAAPRSIAPTTDVPLPTHPSERGRLDGVSVP